MSLVAAIDVGTNTALMLVGRPRAGGGFEVVEDRAVITRLGRGVGRSGRLSQEGIEATLAVLTEFGQRTRELGARVGAVGTSALRDAANASALLEPAALALGVPIEIISGKREAQLTYRGGMHGLGPSYVGATLIDVGGGSTELASQDATGTISAVSIDIGTVRLLDCRPLDAPARATDLDAFRRDVEETFDRSDARPGTPLVAAGGTATTLAAVARAIEPYDPRRIHGLVLDAREIEDWLERLAALPLDARRALPGMTAGREDVLVAGIAIVASLVRRAQAETLTVSDGGVRTGVLLEILAKPAGNHD